MVRFAAMMPETDREVALKIVEQFPEFKSFAVETLDVMEKRHGNPELQQGEPGSRSPCFSGDPGNTEGGSTKMISADERRYIIDLIMETGNREVREGQ